MKATGEVRRAEPRDLGAIAELLGDLVAHHASVEPAFAVRPEAGARFPGLLARRIVCWAFPGETVNCGERFGLIRFGSRVDVYIPLGATLRVAVGEHVKGGETILAELSGEASACG